MHIGKRYKTSGIVVQMGRYDSETYVKMNYRPGTKSALHVAVCR